MPFDCTGTPPEVKIFQKSFMTGQRPVGSRIRRGSVSDVYPKGALSDDLFACEIRLFVNSPSAIRDSLKSP
jgi:hypothetical protein